MFVCCLILCAVLAVQFYLSGWDRFTQFPAAVADAPHEDLAAFYRASELMAERRAGDAYDPDMFRSGLGDGNQRLLMLNPPHFFLLIEPLSYIGYGWAKALILAGFVVAFAAIAVLARSPKSMAAFLILSGGGYYAAVTLNISVLVVAAIVFALVQAERRPFVSAIFLALATVKPQYGLLVPVFLVACGYWRCLWWTCAVTVLMLAVSLWHVGVDVWLSFFNALATPAYQAYADVTAPGNLTLQSAAGKLGFGGIGRYALQAAALLSVGAVIWRMRARVSRASLIGITLLGSGLVAPSLMYYSWPIFMAGLCFLQGERRAWPLALQVSAGLLWLQPIWATVLFTYHMQSAQSYSLLVTANIVVAFVCAVLFAGRAGSCEDAPQRQSAI